MLYVGVGPESIHLTPVRTPNHLPYARHPSPVKPAQEALKHPQNPSAGSKCLTAAPVNTSNLKHSKLEAWHCRRQLLRASATDIGEQP